MERRVAAADSDTAMAHRPHVSRRRQETLQQPPQRQRHASNAPPANAKAVSGLTRAERDRDFNSCRSTKFYVRFARLIIPHQEHRTRCRRRNAPGEQSPMRTHAYALALLFATIGTASAQ